MAGGRGRRQQKMTSLHERIEEGPRVLVPGRQSLVKEEERESWSDLPNDLLALVLSQLNLRDNVCASAVCKSWNTVATSVRVADKAPWLMRSPQSGNFYELYDPSRGQSHFLDLPELRGSRFSYAKDGWLLMYNANSSAIFFFCPYTRELIELPNLSSQYQVVAFSASPKCPSCVIFTFMNVTPMQISIKTCHPGDTQWTTLIYENLDPFYNSVWNKIVFCNGSFYCFSICGCLGLYKPENSTWSVLSTPPPILPEDYVFPAGQWLRGKLVAEHNGELYLVHCSGKVPVLFKFDLTTEEWVEMETIEDMSFFLNSLCSKVKSDLLGNMRNHIYFPRINFYGKKCFSYSFGNGRFRPRNKSFDWSQHEHYESIWIDAPAEDLPCFLERESLLLELRLAAI